LNEGEEKMVMRIWKTRIALGGPLMIKKLIKKDMESKRGKLSLDKEYLVIFLPKCHD
jgi:hypothetical protein